MKKGFTLIELLAVIVILAIILSIGIPILINIVDNSNEKAMLRSADFYLDAVELSIVNANKEEERISDGAYKIINGNMCLNEECKETLKVKVSGEKPTSGNITIKKGKISYAVLELNEQTIIRNSDGRVEYYISPCKLISGDKETVGSKYECEVKPGTIYNFYVLSSEENGTTNLILDRNINSDGTLSTEAITKENAKNGVYNLLSWASKEDYNDDTNYGRDGNNNKGPITAMNFLYNATKTWVNIPNIQMNYEDNSEFGYGKIVTTNNVTKITDKYGTAVTVLTDKEGYINLKARMPMYNEVTATSLCDTSYGSCPLYLVNHLSSSSYITGDDLQNIGGMRGYWLLSSNSTYSNQAVYVHYFGSVNSANVIRASDFGVRPVINLKL